MPILNAKVETIRSSPNNNRVKLGDDVKLGNYVKLGDGVTLGNYVKLGNCVKLGDDVTLGNYVKLGDDVKLGDGVKLLSQPLHLIGSRYPVVLLPDGTIQIGCQCRSLQCWREKGTDIARNEGFTEAQVAEYRGYIEMIAAYVERGSGCTEETG